MKTLFFLEMILDFSGDSSESRRSFLSLLADLLYLISDDDISLVSEYAPKVEVACCMFWVLFNSRYDYQKATV